MVTIHEIRRMTPITEVLSTDLSIRYLSLRQRFEQEAQADAAKGFVSAPFMNKEGFIDPDILSTQAEILAYFFRFTEPTRIIGIPQSGLSLAREVARFFPNARYVQSTKIEDGHPHPNWKQRKYLHVYSFTKKGQVRMLLESVEPSQRYLLIDDVSAYGNAASGVAKKLQDSKGVVVGLGVGFDKRWQDGLQKVLNTCHINVASVITVAEISLTNRVVLE